MLETYPIGRPTIPDTLELGAVLTAIDRIEVLPAAAREAVAGCDDLDHPIRPGAWTIRAVVHHLADAHMNAFLRSKRVLTEDGPTIESVDIDAWARTADVDAPIERSLTLLDGLHPRWVEMLRRCGPAELERPWFVRNDAAPRTLWRSVLIYGWHGDHHVAQIRQVRDRDGV